LVTSGAAASAAVAMFQRGSHHEGKPEIRSLVDGRGSSRVARNRRSAPSEPVGCARRLHRRGNRCRVLVAGRSHRAVDLTSGFDGAALRGPALATSSSTSSRCKDALPFYAELRELGPLPPVSSSETFSACGPGPNPVIGPDASPVFPTARVSRRSSRTPARAPMPPLVSPRERQPWWM